MASANLVPRRVGPKASRAPPKSARPIDVYVKLGSPLELWVGVEGALTVHWPIFDYFYAAQVDVGEGPSLGRLLREIRSVGLAAIDWDIQNHPEHYRNPRTVTPVDLIASEYDLGLDTITQDGQNVYVELL